MATPAVRGRTAPAPGLAVTSPATTEQGDLLIIFNAERNGAGAATHTPANGFALWGSTELDDASADGRTTVVWRVATEDGAVSYTGISSSDGSETLAGMVVLTKGTFDVTSINYAAQMVITTTAPNPPIVTPLWEGTNAIVFSTAFERSSASEANAFTAPSGMGNLIEESADATLHLGIADITVSAMAITGYNPGQWTDTIAPTGSIGESLVISAPHFYPDEIFATTAVTGLSSTSNAGTEVGDLVICILWERAGAGVPTHTIQSGYTTIWSQDHDDGSTDGRLSVAYKIATVAGAQTYTPYTSSNGADCWSQNIIIDAGTFDPNRPYYSCGGTNSTSNAAPNCPGANSVTQGGAGPTEPYTSDVFVFGVAAWHLSAAATVNVTPPTNYESHTAIGSSETSELAVIERTIATPVTNPDPGAFTDDVTPNGTAVITFCIKAPEPLQVAFSGMTPVPTPD